MKTTLLLLAALSGCGSEPLTVKLVTPLGLGSYARATLERCARRPVVPSPGGNNCQQWDTLTVSSVETSDEATLTVDAPSKTTGTVLNFIAHARGEGVATVRVTASAADGQAIHEDVQVSVQPVTAHHLECPGEKAKRCLVELMRLPGYVESLHSVEAQGPGGITLGGWFDFEGTGGMQVEQTDAQLRVTSTAIGLGSVRAVSETVRAVSSPVTFEVVDPASVVALRFVSALTDDSGHLLSPLPVLDERQPAGSVQTAWAVLELADGRWAAPLDGSVRFNGLALDTTRASRLEFTAAGTIEAGVDVGGRRVTAHFTVE